MDHTISFHQILCMLWCSRFSLDLVIQLFGQIHVPCLDSRACKQLSKLNLHVNVKQAKSVVNFLQRQLMLSVQVIVICFLDSREQIT